MNKFASYLFAGLMALYASAVLAQPAQGLGFISPNQKSPIQIEADNGLEWHKKENVYIARGNAHASSGDMDVIADELRGYYRGGEGNGSFELYKLEASGNVRITVQQNKVIADEAYYDLDQGAFVMTGKTMQLLSPTAKLTAQERIEFWQSKNLAVARGNAVVEQAKNRLSADAISAHFTGNGDANKLSIHRIDAKGNVKVQSDGNLATADEATYDMAQGLATLKSNVKLTQGPNQLQGDYAEMNTKTGVSRLLGSKDGGQGIKRVRALVIPDRAKKAGTF
ncbi:MAG: hypothetical protein EYC62_00625 [Alphaproteobacteria bacterium]|nr:MAG: hypothetical protein EYC62_00625 [Alphaproteobacteria bacterium]